MEPHVGGGTSECAEVVERGFVPWISDVQSFVEKC